MAANIPFSPGSNFSVGLSVPVTVTGLVSVGTVVPAGQYTTMAIANFNASVFVYARVVPSGTTPAYTVAATTTDCPVPPISRILLGVSQGVALSCAAIPASSVTGGSTVVFTPGEGGVGQS